MTEFVVDASVAAKWFLNDERHIEEATRYLAGMLADEITRSGCKTPDGA